MINRGIERNEIEKQDSLFLAHTLFRLLSVFYHPAFSEMERREDKRRVPKVMGDCYLWHFSKVKSYVSYKAFKQYEKGDYSESL